MTTAHKACNSHSNLHLFVLFVCKKMYKSSAPQNCAHFFLSPAHTLYLVSPLLTCTVMNQMSNYMQHSITPPTAVGTGLFVYESRGFLQFLKMFDESHLKKLN